MLRTFKMPTVGKIYRGELVEATKFLYRAETPEGQTILVTASSGAQAQSRLKAIEAHYGLSSCQDLIKVPTPARSALLDDSVMD